MAKIPKIIPGDWVSVERAFNSLNGLYQNYFLRDGSRPLTEGVLLFNTNDWRLLVDGNDNFIIQHYNGADWVNIFKFVK